MPAKSIPSKRTKTGRREANKKDKIIRIRQAAQKIFLEKGYDDATVREIAKEAGVAFGTLFFYAKNKRDLLLLLYDDEMDALCARAVSASERRSDFVEKMAAFFEEFLNFFTRNPSLSADMLREVIYSRGGIVAARLWASLRAIEHTIAKLVARAQADGQVSSSVSPEAAAHILWSLYRIEVRICLDAETPDVEGSVVRLRDQFEIVMDGLRVRTKLI